MWTLYEGDCFDYLPSIPDGSVDMVITDPPYNINFIPQRKGVDGGYIARGGIFNDNMSHDSFVEWLDGLCFELDRVLKDDSYLFMFTGWSTIYQFQPVLMKYWIIKALNIWCKNNFGIGYYTRPQYEPFFMCLKGKPVKPEKAPSDLWFYKKVYRNKENPVIHSCQKPVDLIEEIIKCYGTSSTLILDPFAGSGTTGVACENTGRNSILMEKEPEYCNIIRNRLNELSSQTRLKVEA